MEKHLLHDSLPPSDYRLKDNIKPIENALDMVMLMNPVSYNLKCDEGRFQIGLLAHELQLIFPTAVLGNKDEEELGCNCNTLDCEHEKCLVPKYQSIDYTKLIGILVGSIKELSSKVLALEEKQRSFV